MAKKSFMSLFVQADEVPVENLPTYAEEEAVVETVEVDTSNVSQPNDIYAANGLEDLSRSVYKVEEFKSAMPSDMPDAAKKSAVIGVMAVSGLVPQFLLEDARDRIEILKAALSSFTSAMDADIDTAKVRIAELEKQIDMEKEIISKRVKDKEDQTKIINDEVTRIDNVVKFIS